MEFAATKKNGHLVMSRETAEMKEHFIGRIPEGAEVRIKITRIGRDKTNQQVKCHWGLVVGTIRREFDDRGMDLACFLRSDTIPEGQPVPADVIQAVLYACCNDVADDGSRKTLSKMDTIEASLFFDKVRNYAASAWNIQISDPDPAWKWKKQVEQPAADLPPR